MVSWNRHSMQFKYVKSIVEQWITACYFPLISHDFQLSCAFENCEGTQPFASYQLMTEQHFPLISLEIPLLALQPNLWLKHLSFPDLHLNVKGNRTTWQNWPYVIISPKWSLICVSVDVPKVEQAPGEHRALSLCSDMEICRGKTKAKLRSDWLYSWCGRAKAREGRHLLLQGPRNKHKENLPQQRNQNNFIKRQIGLAVPHLGSWRQPTKLAQPCRAPWHWVLTTHSIWVLHTESCRTCLHGLLLFHRPHNRLFCHFKCFKDYHPNAVFSD